MKELPLENYGLYPMSKNEELNSSGGGFFDKLAAGALALAGAPILGEIIIVAGAIDACYSFGKGVVKGWNAYR